MPYVVKRDGPLDTPYCVYKKDGGEKVGCTTKAKLDEYLAALHMNAESETDPYDGVELNDNVELGWLDCAECAGESVTTESEPSRDTSSQPIRIFSMYITRAKVDDKGVKRFSAVLSDTSRDMYGQMMTNSLFVDFIHRINKREELPPPFGSEWWKGGLPYVSVAHYQDHNGSSAVGKAEVVYIDGDQFKAKGVFENPTNPSLVERAWASILLDIENKVPQDQRIRISIAFIDWQHTHGEEVFTRQSLLHECPLCKKGFPVDTFLKGQLVHLALTRVPVNTRTSISPMEVRSMNIKTMQDDASSIVGEDEAKKLQEKQDLVVNSQAIVVKSDADDALPKPYGGATTLEAAMDQARAQETAWNAWSLFDMARDVMWNILDASAEGIASKTAAVEAVLSSLRNQLGAAALEAVSATYKKRSEVQMPDDTPVSAAAPTTHVLDSYLASLKTAFDDAMTAQSAPRRQRLESIQTPLNALGAVIVKSINDATPGDQEDVEAIVERVVTSKLQPLFDKLAAQSAAAVVPQVPATGSRQIAPTLARSVTTATTPTSQAPAASLGSSGRASVHDWVSRSIGAR